MSPTLGRRSLVGTLLAYAVLATAVFGLSRAATCAGAGEPHPAPRAP